ncbi:MAG: septum formation initiator family protein [bacterium]
MSQGRAYVSKAVRGLAAHRAAWSEVGRRILLWALFLTLSGYFLWSAVSGTHGLLSFSEMKKTRERLEKENLELLAKNHAMEKDIYLLRHSRAYLEKTAREEYGYVYPGEKIFWFDEPGDGTTSGRLVADHGPE